MSNLEEKIALYTKSLTEHCGVTPQVDLLKAVTKAMGPSIYRDDAEIVATSDKDEVKRFKDTFIMKKLGVNEASEADAAFEKAVDQMGQSNPRKYRAVLAYLVVENLGKQSSFL